MLALLAELLHLPASCQRTLPQGGIMLGALYQIGRCAMCMRWDAQGCFKLI